MHAIPDPATLHRHLAEIDVLEVYNARLLFETRSTTRRSASRASTACSRARAPTRTSSRESAPGPCGCARFEGPEEFLLSLRTAEILAPAEVARVPPVASSGWRRSRKRSAEEEGELRISVPRAVPTDEIYERYLKKAIAEINELGDELARAGDELRVPVARLGAPAGGHLPAEVRAAAAEIQEGVAFFGRSGQAVLKSLQRLHVDPLAIYGTNCLKFGTEDADGRGCLAHARAPHRAAEARRRHGRDRASSS